MEIKLKEKLDQIDYKEISHLQYLCIQYDKIALKLELDYKLHRENANSINEFMYYEDNKLIGYIGLCKFGGDKLEVNGMVHPDYRRKGVFKRLFSLVMDEWARDDSQKMLLLSDTNSKSGLGFINYTKANFEHSEIEMHLTNYVRGVGSNNIKLRLANEGDKSEIARQNSFYFDEECKEKPLNMSLDEKYYHVVFIAEINELIVGKINLEIVNGNGGIYGFGVLPEFRRNGYGREILRLAIDILREKNAKDIMLQVSVVNKEALNLYKSLGFQETSTMEYHELSKLC